MTREKEEVPRIINIVHKSVSFVALVVCVVGIGRNLLFGMTFDPATTTRLLLACGAILMLRELSDGRRDA